MSISVLITTESKIKVDALCEYLEKKCDAVINITKVNCSECKLPEQPYGKKKTISSFANERINYVGTKYNLNKYDYVISIESGIIPVKNLDTCTVLVLHKGLLGQGSSFGIKIDEKYVNKLISENDCLEYNKKIRGFPITVGEIIKKDNNEIDPKNWMSTIAGIERKDQIIDALENCFINLHGQLEIKETILKGYKSYPDYPKKGVLFQDIFNVLKDKFLFNLLVRLLIARYKFDDIDYIIGLEARGFCLGTVLAFELDSGFIPIRKEGKLPGNVIKTSYKKEYGVDISEIQTDIPNGKRVLIIDDLIATGGSMKAAIELVTKLECKIVDCCVLREVPYLRETCVNNMKFNYSILLQE